MCVTNYTTDHIQTKKSKNVYIMLSRTPTKFGGCIRKLGKTYYNHTAIALDAGLDRLYAYARVQHNALLIGGLVRENVSRYTLQKYDRVNIVLLEIPVTEEQYKWVEDTVKLMYGNDEYKYNLLSVISYPLTKGFWTYKAFSCIEFVMYVLQHLGYQLDKPPCSYKPDELLEMMSEHIYFTGNLLTYKSDDGNCGDYFDSLSLRVVKKSFLTIPVLMHRACLTRKYIKKAAGSDFAFYSEMGYSHGGKRN